MHQDRPHSTLLYTTTTTNNNNTREHHDDQPTLLQRLPRCLPSPARASEGRYISSRLGSILLSVEHINTEPGPRNPFHHTYNHHQNTIALSRRSSRFSAGDEPLPAHAAARTPVPPLYITHNQSLPHTRRHPTEPARIRQLVRGFSRGYRRGEVVHWRPDRNRRRAFLQAGHGEETRQRGSLEP
jgi:hypothetical protein